MNKVSSRSHCLFTINIKKISTKGKILFSKFCLVDLAGSERVAVTGNQGQALKESIEINKSLFILRQVITSLSSNEKHIPFRDSKLTCLLSQSIGGNSWSILIACISPLNTNYEENVSTLMFATKTNTIFNIPTKNIDPKSGIINALKVKINQSEISEIDEIHRENQDLRENVESLKVFTKVYIPKIKKVQLENAKMAKKIESFKAVDKSICSSTKDIKEKKF